MFWKSLKASDATNRDVMARQASQRQRRIRWIGTVFMSHARSARLRPSRAIAQRWPTMATKPSPTKSISLCPSSCSCRPAVAALAKAPHSFPAWVSQLPERGTVRVLKTLCTSTCCLLHESRFDIRVIHPAYHGLNIPRHDPTL
jgi:hypothetical protein